MPGFGSYGQTVKYGGTRNTNITKPKTTYENYIPPPTATPAGIQSQIDYTKAIPAGYTPEQELAMRNRVRATDTAQTRGGVNSLREMMAAGGLGGSGAMYSKIGDLMRGQSAARQGALSNIDISNAQLANQNAFQRGGMLNQLAGMGEGARQFDLGQSANMYQYGTSQDEDTRRYNQQRADYQKQLQDWLNQMGMNGTGSYAGFGG